MASSPHSLNFSSPSPNSKRNSLTQLPLPSGMSTPSSAQSQPITPTTNIFPASAASSTKLRNPGSPTSSTFPATHTTHAGGIQPPASFFHPSRPHYSPPDSPTSHMQTLEDREVFQLSDLKRNSDSTEEQSEVAHGSEGLKSREPLLPIGEAPRTNKRTSMGKDRSDPGRPQNSKTGSSRLRTSFDLVLNLRRGLSMDSHKSIPTPNPAGRSRHRPTHSASSEGGFGSIGFSDKRKLHDEERGYPTTHFASLRRQLSPNSSSHDPSFFVATAPESSRIPPDTGRIQTQNIAFKDCSGRERETIIRKWQLHPSRNRFTLRGHILTGGDSPWAFIVCFSVLCAISGLWFATTCQWWWSQEGVGGKVMVCIGGYLALLVFSSMLKTAFTDPGILPRNLDPDPPYPTTSPSDWDLKVRADVVRVKYCPTCKTYRPPRSSHCKMCDNCVDGCDHHCQWVNNCIGRRNYTTFFVLLLTATITLLLILATSVVHVYLLTRRGNPGTNTGPISFKQAISTTQGAGSAAVFCLSVSVIWPVSALLSYHIRIRNQAHRTLVPGPAPPNPFSHGTWRRNLFAVLCRPRGYSWLDASALATEDRRGVNPGSQVVAAAASARR
ncbi:zf-DHHC-domain-containing protein [Gymnopus androsaceus JB14]|uniref:Palmitoyltransferase n=1 Tax=Gymnopus androsaceus JB14 TaxID=1447944 RepID=A0A6A4IKN3_9AGAR|nr:zf-DHHC-domain-containing protein [Gymnopus androsaceus JB14]